MQRILRRFDLARDEIRTADLLLFRPCWWALHSKLICVAGRTDYCHAGMVRCRPAVNRSPYRLDRITGSSGFLSTPVYPVIPSDCLEMVAGGGRQISLAKEVQWYPGLIDVYEANPENRWEKFDRLRAAAAMRGFVRRRYGWRNMLRVSLVHLPFIRFLLRPETDDQIAHGRLPFCSQAVAAACRAGGVDPVPHLADRFTEPADLARSPFFKYRFTLIP